MRYGGLQEKVDYFAQGNIGNIKVKMFYRLDIVPTRQILKYNGKVLDDSQFPFGD